MENKVKQSKDINNSPSEFISFCIHTAKYKTLPTKKFLNRTPWQKKSPNNILADIPGVIHKIYVKNGQKLNKGDILLELDAMKMYNRILAPFSCVVKKIHVIEKQKVSKNILMIELSASSSKK